LEKTVENALVWHRGLAAPGSRIQQTGSCCRPLLSWIEKKNIFCWFGVRYDEHPRKIQLPQTGNGYCPNIYRVIYSICFLGKTS